MALGSFAEASAAYEAGLQVAPAHPAALLGAAEGLAAAAGVHARQGALGELLVPAWWLPCAGCALWWVLADRQRPQMTELLVNPARCAPLPTMQAQLLTSWPARPPTC